MQIQSEAEALQEIATWSQDRPAWQRDALRRLIAQGELTEQDITELTALCKTPSLQHDPLANSHITGHKAGAPSVALKCMKGVQNVNALVENQSLNFLPNGVTIVYGDNGAGKSGYVRILKHACRARTARGRDEPIHSNIYEVNRPGFSGEFLV